MLANFKRIICNLYVISIHEMRAFVRCEPLFNFMTNALVSRSFEIKITTLNAHVRFTMRSAHEVIHRRVIHKLMTLIINNRRGCRQALAIEEFEIAALICIHTNSNAVLISTHRTGSYNVLSKNSPS